MALVSSQAIPFHSFSIILWHAFTLVVHDPEVVLGYGVALFASGRISSAVA